MLLTQVFDQLQGLDIYEKRTATDELVDVVFENQHAAAWKERLVALLGPAIKGEGEKASAHANKITKAFGGIRPEQTLYYKDFGGYAVMAMFWPWQNGKCTTCKIFRMPVIPEQNPSVFSRLFRK
jgi:hypothetical protein